MELIKIRSDHRLAHVAMLAALDWRNIGGSCVPAALCNSPALLVPAYIDR